jgi:hypothetical protein
MCTANADDLVVWVRKNNSSFNNKYLNFALDSPKK